MVGELRRGLGSGYLKALRARAADAVVECILDDPRCDRQFDSRGWYYGTLAVRLGIPAHVLEPLDAPLVVPVLAQMARAGDAAARRRLPPEPVESPRAQREDARPRPPKRKPLGECSVPELLALPDGANHRIVRELVKRREVEPLVAAARAWNPHAIGALGELGRPELLELGEAPDRRAAIVRQNALERLPFALTRSLAHEWLETDRRAGASLFGAHAGPDDVPVLRPALAAELARGERADQYVICSLAEALGRARAPAPELLDAYREIRYSYGRHFVVEAIAAADPRAYAGIAGECRHDCEEVIRAFVQRP